MKRIAIAFFILFSGIFLTGIGGLGVITIPAYAETVIEVKVNDTTVYTVTLENETDRVVVIKKKTDEVETVIND